MKFYLFFYEKNQSVFYIINVFDNMRSEKMKRLEVIYKTKILILELEIKRLRLEKEELRKTIQTQNELLDIIDEVTRCENGDEEK